MRRPCLPHRSARAVCAGIVLTVMSGCTPADTVPPPVGGSVAPAGGPAVLTSPPSSLSGAPSTLPGDLSSVWSEDGGNLGTNVGGVVYWDGVLPFADLMDQAGDWVSQVDGAGWGEGPALEFDDQGWPTNLESGRYASTLLVEGAHPAGSYAVSWSGSGVFTVNGTEFSGPGSTGTVVLDGESSVIVDLWSSDPADPIRDIDVRLPGHGEDAVFRTGYLRQLAPYRALRFMDWQRTNSVPGDPVRDFTCASRVSDHHYSQGSASGASVERMVDLANAVNADPWFTIPHTASDDWVVCHAEVVAARLDPGLTPRYEFSNETWNPVFAAFHDLSAEAVARGLGADEFEGLQLRTGERHVEVMALVDAVFERTGREVRRVLAGQAANVWVLETRLSVRGVPESTDEIAIAPYLSLPDGFLESDPSMGFTELEVFAALERALVSDVAVWVADHVALAERSGLPLVAYEGGQHLAGDPGDDALTELLVAANRSEMMGDLYRRYLRAWSDATGNALFLHFTDVGPPSRFGSWGALESWQQDDSPKYGALREFASTPPR